MKNFLSLIFILLFFPNLSYGKIPSTNTDHANIEILAESKEIKIGENFVFGILGVISFYVECLVNWRQEDKYRVFYYFKLLNIVNRYCLEVGKYLSEVII